MPLFFVLFFLAFVEFSAPLPQTHELLLSVLKLMIYILRGSIYKSFVSSNCASHSSSCTPPHILKTINNSYKLPYFT